MNKIKSMLIAWLDRATGLTEAMRRIHALDNRVRELERIVHEHESIKRYAWRSEVWQ